jgi:hypothetical protein
MINEFLAPKFPPNHNLRFQQDGATAHSPVISMPLFKQRVISRSGDVPWPPRSPDLTAPELLLWDYLKSKMYSRRPADLNVLKEAIRDEIINISGETLPQVTGSFPTRVPCVFARVVTKYKTLCTTSKTMYNKLKHSSKLQRAENVINYSQYNAMLFAFIIKSVLLPDPVFHSILNYSTAVQASSDQPNTQLYLLPALLLSL